MTMNPGMLLFGLFDAGLAFLLIYNIVKARFGGNQSSLARILGAILGTLTFILYFGAIVWFNTEPAAVTAAVKTLVYAAPIVLAILMSALVLLSAPPKTEETPEGEEEEDTEEENPEPETK